MHTYMKRFRFERNLAVASLRASPKYFDPSLKLVGLAKRLERHLWLVAGCKLVHLKLPWMHDRGE